MRTKRERLDSGQGVTVSSLRARQAVAEAQALAGRTSADVRLFGVVNVDDTVGSEKVVFVSADAGQSWPTFATWTNAPTQSFALFMEDGNFAVDEHGNLLPGVPIPD